MTHSVFKSMASHALLLLPMAQWTVSPLETLRLMADPSQIISIGALLTLWSCSRSPRLWEGVMWEMPTEHRAWFGGKAPEERLMQGSSGVQIQGSGCREGACGSFFASSGEEKKFLKL